MTTVNTISISKTCNQCRVSKLLTEFSRHKTTRDGRRTYCKACAVKMAQRYQTLKPTYIRDYRLANKYGLSVEQYEAMLDDQSYKCVICLDEFNENSVAKRICVDHCHVTKQVRGLLCFNCNTMLGKVKDSPEALRRAAAYIWRNDNK